MYPDLIYFNALGSKKACKSFKDLHSLMIDQTNII